MVCAKNQHLSKTLFHIIIGLEEMSMCVWGLVCALENVICKWVICMDYMVYIVSGYLQKGLLKKIIISIDTTANDNGDKYSL